jgi:predicted Rossmann fold nucleotide-binding protein DprA/Smf involved in DNA uptake
MQINASSAGTIECDGQLNSYEDVKKASEQLFAFAAALWPEEHDAYLEEIEAEKKPAKKQRAANPNWRPPLGSTAEKVLTAWKDGERSHKDIALRLGIGSAIAAMALARLKKAGLLEAA